MEHLAIDLAQKQSQVCIRSQQGDILQESRLATTRLPALLKNRPPSVVILEAATGAFKIADAAIDSGHSVRVVPTTLVRALGVGHRGIKTDLRDARALSEASCRMELPSVHIPTEHSRHIKSLNTSREALVKARTLWVNSIRGYFRGRSIKLQANPRNFPQKVREQLETSADGMPLHVCAMLDCLDTLNEQLTRLDEELARLVQEDERMTRLCSVPGVGPVTASRFVAAIDDVDRFQHASDVTSYFGLTPGERSSGENTRRTRITKAGSSQVRWALVQAAWGLYRSRPNDPVVLWCKGIEQRRGKKIAITALARKLAGILFAIWRDDAQYDPAHSKKRADMN